MSFKAPPLDKSDAGCRSGLDGRHVLIVDDHALFADGLAMLLGRLARGVRVSRVSSCEAALEGPLRAPPDGPSARGRPDLILFDLSLPGSRHLAAYRLLAAHAPGVPLVAVSADERPQTVGDMLRAGARGYIPKSTGAEVLLRALELVLCGGTYVPDLVVRDGAAPPGHGLTRREQQVLELLAAGRANKSIADDLAIAESTVRVHVTSILRRFDVHSRAALLALPAVAALLRDRPE